MDEGAVAEEGEAAVVGVIFGWEGEGVVIFDDFGDSLAGDIEVDDGFGLVAVDLLAAELALELAELDIGGEEVTAVEEVEVAGEGGGVGGGGGAGAVGEEPGAELEDDGGGEVFGVEGPGVISGVLAVAVMLEPVGEEAEAAAVGAFSAGTADTGFEEIAWLLEPSGFIRDLSVGEGEVLFSLFAHGCDGSTNERVCRWDEY